jgi:hypothetical protein
MIMPQGSWQAYAPYLGPQPSFDLRRDLFAINESNGRLFVATPDGQIECLDVKTGTPRWIYAFPPINRTMSYSSPHGMPPYLTQRAANYHRSVQNMALSSGSLLLSETFDPAAVRWADWQKQTKYVGRIILDPNPDDPYSDLWPYYLWLSAYTLAPFAIAGAYILVRRRRQVPASQDPDAAQGNPNLATIGFGCLMLSVSPAAGLFQYGLVSHGWTLALKLIFVLAVLFAVSATWRLFRRRRWIVALILSLLLIAWTYFMSFPLLYA